MFILKEFLFVGPLKYIGWLLRERPVEISVCIPVGVLLGRGATYFMVVGGRFGEWVKLSGIAESSVIELPQYILTGSSQQLFTQLLLSAKRMRDFDTISRLTRR